MGKQDALYNLNGEVKFDEGYFETATSNAVQHKRERGSQRQKQVAVMTESTPLENDIKEKKSSYCRFFKMKVLSNHHSEKINNVVKKSIDNKSIIYSDQSRSYFDKADYVDVILLRNRMSKPPKQL